MSDIKTTRLSKIARELNVGISTIVEFLHKKGVKIDSNPNEKITSEQVEMLLKEFNTDLNAKKESEKLNLRNKREKMETVTISDLHHESEQERIEEEDEVLVKDVRATAVHHEPEVEKVAAEKETIRLNVLGKIDVDKLIPRKKPVEKEREKEKEIEKEKEPEVPVVKPPKAVEPPPPPPPPPPVEEIQPEPEKPVVEEPQPEVRPEPVEDFLKPEIKDVEVKVVGKIDLDSMNQRTRPPKKTREQLEKERRSRMPAQQQQQREERPSQPEER